MNYITSQKPITTKVIEVIHAAGRIQLIRPFHEQESKTRLFIRAWFPHMVLRAIREVKA